MTDYREILRLRYLGFNHSQIAASPGVSRQTVLTTLQRAATQDVDWQAAEGMNDRDLAVKLFPAAEGKPNYKMPDYAYIHRELAKPGMTQQLLWFEYCDRCRDSGQIPCQLTQFKTHNRIYAAKSRATMHINRKPGEIMEVDWAGQTVELCDSDTGEILRAYVFVAVLPYSGYAYAEAFRNQQQDSWIIGHVNAYGYFGGVARMLVPDNLKTGVVRHGRDEIILNKSYQEMAEHYGTAVLPARVRAPKDKATVEGTVGNVSSYILAAIRNHRFFSLKEMDDIIRERLRAFNHKPFQRKDGSRASWFAQERASLLPLPQNPFEIAEWKVATVAFNYHVSLDGQFYSVPFDYIKRKVDVRVTRNVIEVFFEGNRISSHVRLHGYRGQYSTQEAHMPPNHQQYVRWNGERFRNWAAKVGEHATVVVAAILTGHKVEQQGYRACMALLKLSDQYSPQRLEAACAKALEYTPCPGYKTVQSILKSGRDKVANPVSEPCESSPFSFTRGAEYYKEGRE